MNKPKFITYVRVSTKKQGDSGLGLDAQRETAKQYIKANNGEEIESFTEIESGRNGNRPVLKQAIQACKDNKATLLIAKLDRLSRNVAFLFNLKEELEQAGVGFVAGDLPDANNTMVLGVMATVAQFERERISQRIKEAIPQSSVYQAGNWGNPENLTDADRQKAWKTIKQNARTDEDTVKAFHFIEPRREKGMSYQAIADELNAVPYRTRRGKKFHPAQVRKIYLRFTHTKSKKTMKRNGNELTRLIQAAKELNHVLGLEPPIDTGSNDREYLTGILKQATTLIMPDDRLSPETLNTLKNLPI